MLNSVVLIGRLTRNPEVKFTQSQKAVCTFTLAVSRNFTTQSGEREADFITVVVWGRTAENIGKYLTQGSLIAVEGRIQTRSYDTPQGEKRYVTEVVGDSVQFLESKNSGANQSQSINNQDQFNSTFPSKPVGNDTRDPFADFGNSIDISDDDLPF